MTAKDKNAAHARLAENVRRMYEQIGRAYVSGDTKAIPHYEMHLNAWLDEAKQLDIDLDKPYLHKDYKQEAREYKHAFMTLCRFLLRSRDMELAKDENSAAERAYALDAAYSFSQGVAEMIGVSTDGCER